MKDVMREADAVYGGEMSAHHYFRALRLLRQRADSLAARDAADVRDPASRSRRWWASASRSFPASGEINRKVADAKATIERVQEHYRTGRALDRFHRRPVDRVRPLALQPALARTPSR